MKRINWCRRFELLQMLDIGSKRLVKFHEVEGYNYTVNKEGLFVEEGKRKYYITIYKTDQGFGSYTYDCHMYIKDSQDKYCQAYSASLNADHYNGDLQEVINGLFNMFYDRQKKINDWILQKEREKEWKNK